MLAFAVDFFLSILLLLCDDHLPIAAFVCSELRGALLLLLWVQCDKKSICCVRLCCFLLVLVCYVDNRNILILYAVSYLTRFSVVDSLLLFTLFRSTYTCKKVEDGVGSNLVVLGNLDIYSFPPLNNSYAKESPTY